MGEKLCSSVFLLVLSPVNKSSHLTQFSQDRRRYCKDSFKLTKYKKGTLNIISSYFL